MLTATFLAITQVWAAPAAGAFVPDVFLNDVLGDDPDAVAAGEVLRATAAPHVIYSNFSDGTTTLIKGKEDATKNSSAYCGSAPYPAWSGSEDMKKQQQNAIANMMKDFNVVLAAKRPVEGPYTMIMIGPPSSTCSSYGAQGVSMLDCNDKNPSNIVFVFTKNGGAITMAQEVAHSFGLSHNDAACDVMGAGYSSKGCPGGKWGYPDVDGAVLSLGQPTCGSQTQNSYQMMKKVLGDWPGGAKPDPMGDGGLCADQLPPVVEITSPRDGETVGNDFRVEASAGDDCNVIKQVRIEVPAEGLDATSETAPFAWNLTGVADTNDLQIIVHATDASGKESDAATIHVKVGAGAGGGNNDPGAGGQGGGSGEQGDATSGGCSLAGHPAVATLPLLPLLLLSRPRVVRRKPPA